MLTITFCLEDGPKRYSEYQLEPSFLRALPFSRRQLCAQGDVGRVRAQLFPTRRCGRTLSMYIPRNTSMSRVC